jgi:hypothetical protein
MMVSTMSLIGVLDAAEAAPELAAGLVPAPAAVLLLPELLHPTASVAAAATATAAAIFVSLISD